MEEISNENIEGQRETKTSWTNQIVVLDKTLVNMINQQVMIKYPNHDYVDSQLLDCGVDKLMMSKQNFVDMMTQHGSKAICNVDNTRSSDSGMSLELPNAMSIELVGQQVFTIAHVDVNMNLSGR